MIDGVFRPRKRSKALEIASRSLEARSDALLFWLNFFIALVVLGVVIEVFVVIKEYRHAKAEFLRGIIHSPPRPSRLDLFLNLLGAILVAIGVAGEFGVGLKVSTVESELRNNNRKLVGLLNVEAGNANREAGEARNDAESAKATAKGFEASIANSNSQAKHADERATANEREAERLRGENLLLQTDVLKLRERMADRHLTPKQQSAIANKLCPQFGGLNLTIGLYSADGEMNALAADIDGALPLLCPNNRIGWAVSISPSQTPEGFSGSRIFVYEGASFRVRLFASALFEALKSEGLQVEGPMTQLLCFAARAQ